MYVGFTLASQQHPALEDLLPKISLEKLSILHTVFLKNRLQINKNNYRVMLFMSKQVSVPKISLILQEMKLDPKVTYTSFLHASK